MENRSHTLAFKIGFLSAVCALFLGGCASLQLKTVVVGEKNAEYKENETDLLIGGAGGFLSLNPSEKKQNNKMRSSFTDRDGVFWMLFNEKLYRFQSGKFKLCSFNVEAGEGEGKAEGKVTEIFLSYRKEILALVKKDPETCLVLKYAEGGWRKIRELDRSSGLYGDLFCYEDSSGRLITVNGEGSLYVNGLKTGRIVSRKTDKLSLAPSWISAGYLSAEEDDKGRLWIWTRWLPDYDGNIICLSGGKMNLISLEDMTGKSLPSCIKFLGGEKLILSSGYLPAKYYRITEENGEVDLRAVAADPLVKYKLNISSCFVEAPDKIWLIARQEKTWDYCLWFFNGSEIKKIKEGDIFSGFAIGSMSDPGNLFLKEPNGNLWVASNYNGALLVTEKSGAEIVNWTKGLSLRNVTGIHRDGEGNIFFVNSRYTVKSEDDLIQILLAGSLRQFSKMSEEKYKMFISRENIMFSSSGAAWWVKAGETSLNLVKYENGAEPKVLGLEEIRQKFKKKYAESGDYRLLYTGIDSADRIWLYYSETVLIYDPKTGELSDFYLEDAYLDALKKKIEVKVSTPQHRVFFTPEGAVVYVSEAVGGIRENRYLYRFKYIGWYNGSEWKSFLPLKGTKRNEQFAGDFFLNKEGRLTMNTVYDDLLPASSFSFIDGGWKKKDNYEVNPAEESADKLLDEMRKKTGIDYILNACRIDSETVAIDSAYYGVVFFYNGKTLKLKGFPKSGDNNRLHNFWAVKDKKNNIWIGRKSFMENEWVLFSRDTLEKEGEIFDSAVAEKDGKEGKEENSPGIARTLESAEVKERNIGDALGVKSGVDSETPKEAVKKKTKVKIAGKTPVYPPAGTLEGTEAGRKIVEIKQAPEAEPGSKKGAEKGEIITAGVPESKIKSKQRLLFSRRKSAMNCLSRGRL